MIDKHRRHYVYDTVFQFIIDNNLKVFPISVQKLCSLLNTELVTLSDIVRHSNLRIKDVFDIWGNEDGCVMAYEHNGTLYHKIAYNDNKPLERIRFTVCEECMHILLGHTKNPSFNAFQQSYSPPTYAQYDEEARIGAGLIICPSQFYYAHSNEISSTYLCRICRISEPCANIRIKVLDKYKNELQQRPLYKQLPPISVSLTQLQNKKFFEIVRDNYGKATSFRLKKLPIAM